MSQGVQELKKFCETTSVAGVSRIVRTKEFFLKLIWTFFLLLCTGLLVYFLVTLFIEYYKWPTTTEFGEDLKNDIVFPDVTICSLNRIVNDETISPIVEEYFKFIKELMASESYLIDHIQSAYSLPFFLASLPKMNVIKEDCPKFITDCRIYGKDWQMAETCTDNFTEIWNADYYSCFTIRPSQLNISEGTTVRGMTLVLNNGPPRNEQLPYNISLQTTQGTGLKFTIHNPGTPPDLKRGITLTPGTETDIDIVQTNIERLDKPYNPLGCTKQKFMTLSSETYARDQCIDYCIQDKIYKECDCVARWLAIPKYLNDAFVCGNLTRQLSESESENGIEEYRVNRSRDIAKETKDYCLDNCLIPCSEKRYEHYVSSTLWPQNSLQLGIYETYFDNCIQDFPRVRKRFAAYEYLVNLNNDGSITNSSNKSYSFNDLKEVGESLLVVKLVIENDFPFMQVDKPLYTWDVVVGVVGGLLSLWLGISAVAVAEVFELIYFLLKGCFR